MKKSKCHVGAHLSHVIFHTIVLQEGLPPLLHGTTITGILPMEVLHLHSFLPTKCRWQTSQLDLGPPLLGMSCCQCLGMALIFFVALSMSAGIRKSWKSSQTYHKMASLETSLLLRQPEVLFQGWKALQPHVFLSVRNKKDGILHHWIYINESSSDHGANHRDPACSNRSEIRLQSSKIVASRSCCHLGDHLHTRDN